MTDPDRCERCRRPLHSPMSRAAGHGPTCALRELGKSSQRRQRAPDGQLTLDVGRAADTERRRPA